MNTATAISARGIDFHSIGNGFWEEVKFVDKTPRPDGHEGGWGNGTTVYHVVGAQSGLIAIQRHKIGGFETWFTPEMIEIEWPDQPEFHRSTLEKMINDQQVSHVFMFE